MKHNEILSDLRRIIRAVNLEGKRVEKEYGVSIPQYLCLNFLHEANGFCASMSDLKDALQLNPSTMTGIVQRMEKVGYVARLPKADDRRKNLIILTDRGANIIRKHPQILHEQLLNRLDAMGEDDYGNLQMAFLRIIEFLDIQRVDAAPIVTPGSEIGLKATDGYEEG